MAITASRTGKYLLGGELNTPFISASGDLKPSPLQLEKKLFTIQLPSLITRTPPEPSLPLPRNKFDSIVLLLPCLKTTAPWHSLKILFLTRFPQDLIEITSVSPSQCSNKLFTTCVFE